MARRSTLSASLMRCALWLSVAASGCVADRTGPEGWSGVKAPSSDAGHPVDLYVFGGRDRWQDTRELAVALEGRISEDSSVLWLGDSFAERDACDVSPKRKAQLEALDAVIDDAAAFAVGSPYDRMCGASGPSGARTPDTHYMIDLGDNGVRVHTPCYVSGEETPSLDAVSCPHELPDEDARVRLLVIDETLWFQLDWDDGGEAAQLELARLDAIVDAIPENPSVPYLLVTHYPIETEGPHGLGAWQAQATFRHHPKSVQRALADGRITGVIAGLEHNLQVSEDIGLAVKRSAREWLARPVFQVVSGAVGEADRRRRGGIAASRRQTGQALKNERFTQRAGFVHLHGNEQALRIDIHARFGSDWRNNSTTIELDRPPHPARTPAPPLTPCRDCDPVQGATDGEKWEKRRD